MLESIKPDEFSASLSDAETLIVDDSGLMRIVLTKAPQELGFTHINEALNGREAIQKLQEKSTGIP